VEDLKSAIGEFRAPKHSHPPTPCYNEYGWFSSARRVRVIEFLQRPRLSVLVCAICAAPGGTQHPINES